MRVPIAPRTIRALYWLAGLIILLILGCCSLLSFPERKNESGITSCETVARLVEASTQNAASQAHAFRQIEDMGGAAVPCIVRHLGDLRKLPDPQISLSNRGPHAFEERAHYGAEFVHDALEAILRQLTDENIGAFDADRPSDERDLLRKRNRHRWILWCRTHYPERASDCG